MESHNLHNASRYLNNLLLARGLLQNGKAIDFAQSNHHASDNDATMLRIINLVHDLVLRRDRDADQREALAINIRALRSEESQRLLDMQRAQDKNAELTRNLSMAEAQERGLRASVRKAEVHARELRDQMLKTKSMLDQVRAKCLSDVRKRDAEIEKLKGHITGMQRGKREASGMKINVINPQPLIAGAQDIRNGQDTNSAEWSLEKETNDFLAALVNETSTENVRLRDILQDTRATLRELTGLAREQGYAQDDEEGDGIGIPGQYRKSRQKAAIVVEETVLVSCETLAADMSLILDHCRSILRDPSFVPIEEVQIREDEIIKLREGWEKMASRWRDAVTMMDTWRKRMLEGGETILPHELSGLEFGRSIAVLPNGQPVLGQESDISSIVFDSSQIEIIRGHHAEQAAEAIAQSPDPKEEVSDVESDLDIPAEPSPKRLAASPARRGLKLSRPSATLGEISSNIRGNSTKRTRDSSLTRSGDSGIGSLDGSVDAEMENDSFPTRTRVKLPRQTAKENVPSLTVAEKLAIIEAEAREAEEQRHEKEAPHKRKTITETQDWRKGNRRKSTLSPDELAALMGIR